MEPTTKLPEISQLESTNATLLLSAPAEPPSKTMPLVVRSLVLSESVFPEPFWPTERSPLFVQLESASKIELLLESSPIQAEPLVRVLPFVAIKLLFPPRAPTTRLLEIDREDPLSKTILFEAEASAPSKTSSPTTTSLLLSVKAFSAPPAPTKRTPLFVQTESSNTIVLLFASANNPRPASPLFSVLPPVI